MCWFHARVALLSATCKVIVSFHENSPDQVCGNITLYTVALFTMLTTCVQLFYSGTSSSPAKSLSIIRLSALNPTWHPKLPTAVALCAPIPGGFITFTED